MELHHIKHLYQETVNIQNTALFIAIDFTRDTNVQDLQDKTNVQPMGTHLKLHATHLKQMTQTQTHPTLMHI